VKSELSILNAIRVGDADGISRLLDNTSLIGWIATDGHGVIFHAVFHCQWKIVDILLAHGADIDATNSLGWTPLFWAAFNGHVDTVGRLIALGANPNVCTANGDYPLFMAAYKGYGDVVRLLLAGGAEAQTIDASGLTAFSIAKIYGHEHVLDALKLYTHGLGHVQRNSH
jgi:uncharacterized protein